MPHRSLFEKTKDITDVILKAKEQAFRETDNEPEPEMTQPLKWPVQSTVGPGLEGAIACETKIGYVNGRKGWLVYRGYNIFDLCAYCTYEEVSYLLLNGSLPTKSELEHFNRQLVEARKIPNSLRLMMGFPIQDMNPMASLRIGVNMLRQRLNWRDLDGAVAVSDDDDEVISTDEDAIPQEENPRGEERAIYEFKKRSEVKPVTARASMDDGKSMSSCIHLISAMSTLTAAISRIRQGHIPIEWNDDLSHAANLLYMVTGKIPTPKEERIMDVALILHADHGMNASTFASMVVASTLSDIYFSVGAGIGALNGPLHGGANEQVLKTLKEIGSEENVKEWYQESRKAKRKVMGFGHRVYKAYDPRARILAPLAEYLAKDDPQAQKYYNIAKLLEHEVTETLGKEKGIFPNVDYFSGIVYGCLGIPQDMFTPVFAVARTAGWTARIIEYMENNRIFRPRAMYTGGFESDFKTLEER